MKINPRLYHIALLLYCILIFILSSIPGETFPKVDFEFSDKIVHLIVYGILFILFFYSLKNQSKYVKLQKYPFEYSLIFAALYEITDELHQYFVPNRSCELADWIADLTGIILMYVIMKVIYSKRKTLLILIITLFILCGCSAQKNSNNVQKPLIKITEEQAWLNLMPVIGSLNNIFCFSINMNVTGGSSNNYSIKDLNIYFDNDTLINKKFIFENITGEDGTVILKMQQSNEEFYIDNSKPRPEEAQFTFNIYDGSRKLTTTKTSKLTIQKVY